MSSGEVFVGYAPNTQLILYDMSSPVDIPDTITGTLFITNYQLCFRPIPFLICVHEFKKRLWIIVKF